MPNNSLYLFEEILPNMTSLLQELESPRLRNVFNINKNEVQLILTDNHVLLSEALNFRQPTHHYLLAFDTKFEVIYLNSVLLTLSRPKILLEFPPRSNLKGKDVPSSSHFQPSPLLSRVGPLSWRRESTREDSTSCSRPKKRLEKAPSPRSI
jgi:hypothetical protein